MLTVQLANMITLVRQIFTSNAAIVYLHVSFPTPPIPLQVLVSACRRVLLSPIRHHSAQPRHDTEPHRLCNKGLRCSV